MNLNTKLEKITEQNKKKVYDSIFSIRNAADFNKIALMFFDLHYRQNPTYRRFCDALNISFGQITSAEQIPCLPINVFREHKVLLSKAVEIGFFESSGTTNSVQSKHFITDYTLYERSFLESFQHFYYKPEDCIFMALLPAYLERPHSSLVYMTEKLIQKSAHPLSAFYLYDHQLLYDNLMLAKKENRPVFLLGVSFALLDFVEKYTLDLPDLILMETGGMKGRREEITRDELHERLKQAFHVKDVHSEYGMTELFSQAYSKQNGRFFVAPWMKVMLRDISDPMSNLSIHKRGAVNIIDLANLYSCPFLATDDIGLLHDDSSFEILGRLDFSIMRGCNVMVDF